MKKKVKNEILQGLKNERIRENEISLKYLPILLFVGLKEKLAADARYDYIVCIPADYKKRIEKILCHDSLKRENFSLLIDMNMYFKDQEKWEHKFDKALKVWLEWLDYEYDSSRDCIVIKLKRSEMSFIYKIFSRILMDISDFTQAKEFYQTVDHFTDCLGNKRNKIFLSLLYGEKETTRKRTKKNK